jgi:cupin superfamily acireductone dioxygenase involved in methionine salvage
LRVRVFLLQFLVRLVSSYRYAGEHVDDELAMAEAAELHAAVVTKKEVLHGDVVRIVSSRSKPQLKATFERYKQEHGKAIDEVPFLSSSTTHPIKIFSLTLICRMKVVPSV